MNLAALLRKEKLTRDDLAELIALESESERALLYNAALQVKARFVGRVVYYRGLIEFSNYCTKNCLYCGIRKGCRQLSRFETSVEEIGKLSKWICDHRYGSVCLQSGERSDPKFVQFIEDAVREVKRVSEGRLGITLCVGEQTEETYRRWFEAGAHRYLLRIEESNPELYASLHPADGHHLWRLRDACIDTLKKVGYQVGTGVMIGLPGQTAEHLADDVLYYERKGVDMIGMGPYIVSHGTPMGDAVAASGGDSPEARRRRFILGLNMIAVTRLYLRNVNIAATTALSGLDEYGRELGLLAGANVLMPAVTPECHRADYQLYDGKPGIADSAESCGDDITERVESVGDAVGFDSWGDSGHYFESGAHQAASGQKAGDTRKFVPGV